MDRGGDALAQARAAKVDELEGKATEDAKSIDHHQEMQRLLKEKVRFMQQEAELEKAMLANEIASL